MAKTSTKKSAKAEKSQKSQKAQVKVVQAEVEVKETPKPSTETLTRMVVEVPTEKVKSFKVLCDLLGTTQGRLVGKALDKYIDDNKALVDQFVKLRTQIGENIEL